MKKVNKISLSLGSLGILMIAVAILLQYTSFQVNDETFLAYQKVTMTDVTMAETYDQVNITSEKSLEMEDTNFDAEVEKIVNYEDIETIPIEPIVYDNMTLNQLAEKINRSLKSTISEKGYLIASYALEKGVDPYLATAIMLHETGCNSGSCSNLVKSCNNVGGQKGAPSCGGAYKAYPTLDDGIKGFIDNLAKNYYAYGLTTPETMASKYAASTSWASKVNSYIYMIRNK